MKAMEIPCNTSQKEGFFLCGKILDLRSLCGFQTCCNLRLFCPPLDMVKFYPSLQSPPFETHFNPLSSTAWRYHEHLSASSVPVICCKNNSILKYVLVGGISANMHSWLYSWMTYWQKCCYHPSCIKKEEKKYKRMEN